MQTQHDPWRLEVLRTDFSQAALRRGAVPPLADGQVRLHIERLAFTANTMTYAAMGDQLALWPLFPAQPGWGRIPAWGHARVIESRADGVAEGALLFGLLPMSSHAILTVRPSRLGVRETSAHRAAVNPVYNQYALEAEDDEAALESKAAFHPLFITSFVLDLHLEEQDCYGADQVIVVSASSKTALGFAFLQRGRLPALGLTSSRNLDWLQRIGLFGQVSRYEEAEEMAYGARCLVVDFSGDASLLDRLQRALGARCVRLVKVGSTHGGRLEADAADDRVEAFSGPLNIERRAREWGAAEFDRRLRGELAGFVAACGGSFESRHADGADALLEGYHALRRGELPASAMLIARPNHAAEGR